MERHRNRRDLEEGISAVVVVGRRRERAVTCLEALLAQDPAALTEVILVDLSAPGTPALPGSEHPVVRCLRLPPTTLFAAARARGVAAARAPVVAFLEEHCHPLPGWAEALRQAHRGPWAAVGPQVLNANPGAGRSDLTYLMNYGLFAPPVEGGETDLLPGQNSSYKRHVLAGYGEELERLLASDNVLMQRLAKDGHRLYLEPRARAAHLNEGSLRSIVRGYFWYHRGYGHLRAEEHGWSRARRLAYVVLAPAIPLYFLVRFRRRLARRGLSRGFLLRHAPFIYAVQLMGALGQALGLLFGEGDSYARFTEYELTEFRPPSGHGRAAVREGKS